ncbi:MAG: response regulator [Thermodesulfobacteriota bacterium]|nr:response regulator [Thermodesulfobacteriota bacterium]
MSNDPYKYFMIEAVELLDNLNRDILEFENRPDDHDLLKRLFRYAHTLKGAAHVVGLLQISKLAHSIEDLFVRARDQNIPLRARDISLIIETVDLVRNVMEAVKGGKPEDSVNCEALLERFQTYELKTQGSEIEQEKGEYHSSSLPPQKKQSVANNRPVDPIRQTDGVLPAAQNSQRHTGPLSHPTASAETIRVSISDIDYLMDQASELVTGAIRIEQLHNCFKAVTRSCRRMMSDYYKIKGYANRISESGTADMKQLDEFIALSGKIDIESLHSNLTEHTGVLDATVEELKQISDSMYQVIHRIRSIRISDISHYFRGAIRDLSMKLDKKLTLVIKGDYIELDRNLLEELKEPVNQIIRNAAVHGIEDEAERLSKGKDPEGVIEIGFSKIGDYVHIVIEDDGRGISIDRVKEIAVQKGVIDEKKAGDLDREESIHLVFVSGVSSGEIITEFAGRGVGLDIVKDKIESLRGAITIETEEDKYTRVSIKLPLSLNMINAFLVEASGHQFLIPLNMVTRTGYVSHDEIEYVAGRNVIKLNESPVSLMMLSDILGLESNHDGQRKRPFVLLKSGHEISAFAVDQILGVHRIIIKRLGEQLEDVNCILGGAILSGGHPALVLDVSELFRAFTTETPGLGSRDLAEEISAPSIPRILAVDDSLTTRVLISGVLEAEGYEVTLAGSGEEALNTIHGDKYDLFIFDVEMPGINGFELAARTRKNPDHKDTPIIILSSLSKDEHKRKGIEVGAQAYIVKGQFDQGIFLETVRRLI